jgi:hypothetical protein
MKLSDEERRRRYLAAQSKYNTSSKGQARNRAYEERHPERAVRWEPARDALRRGGEQNADRTQSGQEILDSRSDASA